MATAWCGWVGGWGGAVAVWACAVVLAAYTLPRLWGILRSGRIEPGDPAKGVVLFAESLRWLGVRWGRCEAGRGLRRAGFEGQYLFWDWDPTWRAVLVLPTIAAPRFLDEQARRLAERIGELRRGDPLLPIHVMGYSCGGFIAVRALELLAGDVQVDSCALLAAAFSPWRDLRPAASHVRGRIVVASSPVDVVVGLGTLAVGTCDRSYCPSIGALGYLGPACEKVAPLRWRPEWIRLGHWGGHFSAPATAFVAERVAPLMALASGGDGRGTRFVI